MTVHLVDKGIDTGNILDQKTIITDEEDNYLTYPLIQLGEGLILLIKQIPLLLNNKTKIKLDKNNGKLWYHPTIITYIINRVKYNVK